MKPKIDIFGRPFREKRSVWPQSCGRYIFVLIVCLTLNFPRPLFAQNEGITIDMKDVPIREVLERLEEITGYAFIFNDNSHEGVKQRVSAVFNNCSLNEILSTTLRETGLSFNVEGKQVAIYATPTAVKPTPILRYSGQVTDAKHQPMAGVTVFVANTNKGVLTDKEGRFWIKTQAGSVLMFSYLGYDTQEIVTDAEKGMLPTVIMTESAAEIEDVVVVGYGVQTKASTVASITQTSGEDIMGGGNVNTVSEALQGRLNGVVTIQSTGKPGDSAAEIYIRGKSSWQNTTPLVLVDGIERNMDDIDMNEIATISVLKDASATAVYGVRGGNGVILVTTKRGTDNSRPTINFSANIAMKQFTQLPYYADYLSSMKAWNEAAATDKKWDLVIPESTIKAWENAFATGNYGPYNDYFPQVDWYDFMVTKPGVSQNYNANISGGSEWLNYFASIGYQYDGDIFNIDKQPDFDPRNYMRRYNWRSNFDFKPTKTTTVSVNIAGRMQYVNNSIDSDFAKLMQAPSNNFPVKYSDGYWGDNLVGGYNPYANFNTQGQIQEKRFIGWYDFSLKQDLGALLQGLSVQAKLSYSQNTSTRSSIRRGTLHGNGDALGAKSTIRYNRTWDYANPIINEDNSVSYPLLTEKRHPDDQTSEGLPVSASYDNLNNTSRRLYYEFAISYNRSFNDHNVSLLALMNRQIYEEKGSGSTMEFPSYREDWVGRITYNWKQRYLAEFNISYTGSEKFAPGHRFGLFPSMSVGWRMSEESFIKKRNIGKWLTNLKFRYSYGQVGSDAGAGRFNYVALFNTNGNVSFGESSNVAVGPTYVEGNTANINSTWETSTKQNLGVEIGLWDKLSVMLDLFDEKRTGMLMTPQTMAFWFGADLPSVNMGKTKSHGLELEVSWHDRIGKSGVSYWANFNFATSENRNVYRDDPVDLDRHLKNAGKPIQWQPQFLSVGNFGSIDDIFNYAQTSISGTSPGLLVPGDLVYIDFNGDGIINGNDKVVVKELNYPLTTFSLNFGVSWKGLSFSTLLYAPINVYKLVPHTLLWDFPQNNIKAQPSLSRWTYETANTTGVVSPPSHHERQHNVQDNTYSYRNYSYLRIKNIELSYTLPKRWQKALSMSGASVFIKCNNLATFSNVDDRIDPETSSGSAYPIVRTYTMGVRFSF